MSEIDEVMVEKAARAIEPEVWARFDNATRPYIENRGASCDCEQHWYALTWAAGCRSVEDVKNWWTICDDAVATWDVHVWRQSWNKARAALTAIFPDLREKHYAECTAGIVAWLKDQWYRGDLVCGDELAAAIDRGGHITKEGKPHGAS